MYRDRLPPFSIGPDDGEDEGVDLAALARAGAAAPRPQKTAGAPVAPAAALTPRGGLFWDGRADTLQQQALGPLLDPREMDGGSIGQAADRLRRAAYSANFATLFGSSVLKSDDLLVGEAMSAVARYETEDSSFHPYTSKFDSWLAGATTLSPAEARGFLAFDDPKKGNCAACHLDKPGPDGVAPAFTDYQFEALGAPRNRALAANDDPAYFDLGLCGPIRADLSDQTQYCGFFKTPTLRNVATRSVFFHNGVFSSLDAVLDFYALRDAQPETIYPRASDGRLQPFDDLPAAMRANVDATDKPFGLKPGDPPPLTRAERSDIVAFLKTLTDGWTPTR